MNTEEHIWKVLENERGMVDVDSLKELLPKPEPEESVKNARALNRVLKYLGHNFTPEAVNELSNMQSRVEDEASDLICERIEVNQTEIGNGMGHKTVVDPITKTTSEITKEMEDVDFDSVGRTKAQIAHMVVGCE